MWLSIYLSQWITVAKLAWCCCIVRDITIRTFRMPVRDEATDGCYVLLPELAAAADILVGPLHCLCFTVGEAQMLLWCNWSIRGSRKLDGNKDGFRVSCTIMFDIFYFYIVHLNFENSDDLVTQKTTKWTTLNSCTVVVTFQWINKSLMGYKCVDLTWK